MFMKEKKSDEFYCESVAKSISEIIRFSLDEDFRKSSFKLFGVSSTKETEKEIRERLKSIIDNVNAPLRDKATRKRRKKLAEEDIKNFENKQETFGAKDVDQSSSTVTSTEDHNVRPQGFPQNFFQKNWLQVSSQKYMNAVKRRKLNYFSQPPFGHAYENENEFSKYDLHFSNSQPTSVSGSSLLFNKTTESTQLLENEVNFCQKMFNVSFKDNAQKYLKKNSKSYKF